MNWNKAIAMVGAAILAIGTLLIVGGLYIW